MSYLVSLLSLDPNNVRYFAVVVISFLGLTLIIPALGQKVEGAVSRLSGIFGGGNFAKHHGFGSGFITGCALGIVWTPCAGPILATIATLAATQSVTPAVVLVTLVYVAGVGVPLFLFATAGQVLLRKTRVLSRYTAPAQKVFGVIMILTAISIATNYDKVLQTKLLAVFPQYSNLIVNLESNSAVQKQLDVLQGRKESSSSGTTTDLFNENTPAPDFVGVTKWLNTDKPLTIADLKGKVVLVDFWTYTCINCIRTLPYVTSWYDKYKDQGFVVVGVHTPEFAFEKDTNNVLNAIKQYNIHYPVAQDNNYATWTNYNNRYWPAKYLIDANGVIRKTHFGEGGYSETEKAIQELLKEAGKNVSVKLEDRVDQAPTYSVSPETYLGSSRMEYYFPSSNLGNGKKKLTLADSIPENSFNLGGEWLIEDEQATTGSNAVLQYRFVAGKVFLVLRPPSAKKGTVKVYLDGKLIPATQAGSDVINGIVTVTTDRLYNLVDLHGKPGQHLLKLEFQTPGVEAFAFTFG